jgi:putative effector of murein hydrolase
MVVTLLEESAAPYKTYFQGAQFIHFLLGPTTVALAIPLYRQFERIRQNALAVIASVLIGSLTGLHRVLMKRS